MCERKIQSLVQTLHSARHPHSALQVAYDTQNTGVWMPHVTCSKYTCNYNPSHQEKKIQRLLSNSSLLLVLVLIFPTWYHCSLEFGDIKMRLHRKRKCEDKRVTLRGKPHQPMWRETKPWTSSWSWGKKPWPTVHVPESKALLAPRALMSHVTAIWSAGQPLRALITSSQQDKVNAISEVVFSQ